MADETKDTSTTDLPSNADITQYKGAGRMTSAVGTGVIEGVGVAAATAGIGAIIGTAAGKKAGKFAEYGAYVGAALGGFHGGVRGSQNYDQEQTRLAALADNTAKRESALQATISKFEAKEKYTAALEQEKAAAAAAENTADKSPAR